MTFKNKIFSNLHAIFLGDLTVWRNGVRHNPDQVYQTYFLRQSSFPRSNNGKLILGQDTDDQSVPYGIRDSYRAFQGYIMHFMLWQRSISEKEVIDAYNKAPAYDQVIVGWDKWKRRVTGSTIQIVRFDNSNGP